ncbi:MAG: hypothetical protein PHY45_13885 [Rhodocyclaceae bacterium]|nr:hypothetical protein [Rhodocyclaceae bacterium]
MRLVLLAVSLLIGLCACNPVPPLTNDEKAKYVHELLESEHSCDSYRARLAVPALDGPAIEIIYREALKAGCIKHDV